MKRNNKNITKNGKFGFTLIELIAVIVVIGLVAVIAFPSVTNILKSSRQNTAGIQTSEIVRAAKDWGLEHPSQLPIEGQSTQVKLSELKKGYISLNVKNLETGVILSNETYVNITKQGEQYQYEVVLYDIPSIVEQSNFCKLDGDFNTVVLNDISEWDELSNDISTTCLSGYSVQYFVDNEEVPNIQTEKTTSIVYTFLSENKIYKRVKVVTVR